VRLARVEHSATIWLARLERDDAVLLQPESTHPSADALREALADSADLAAEGKRVRLNDVRLLAPVRHPSKVLAIGLNYIDHARESGLEPPAAPVVFAKMPNSVIGPDDTIRYRRADSSEVDYEAELAVVIGRQARDVSESDALHHVLGYTVCNDVSARDAQFADAQWVRGKSFDTFCPLGPWITTTDDIADVQALSVRCRVNGELLQNGSTSDMIFGVTTIVSYVSRFMTLEPGDVIATGTPFGVGFARTPPIYLVDGDVVECEVEGLGTLRNTVAAQS